MVTSFIGGKAACSITAKKCSFLPSSNSNSFLTLSSTNLLVALTRVVTYYLGRPALALHCFRLAFILRHNILEHEQRNPDNVEYPALRGLKGTHDLPFEARQDHSDSFVSIFAIAEAAAALTLNNVGTCLASVGEKGSAAESLTIASSVTT